MRQVGGTRVIGCVCEGNGPGVYEMLEGYLLPIYDGIWTFLFFFSFFSRPHIFLVLSRGMLRGFASSRFEGWGATGTNCNHKCKNWSSLVRFYLVLSILKRMQFQKSNYMYPTSSRFTIRSLTFPSSNPLLCQHLALGEH